jgi:SnoaL-like polyketide cyclase
MGTTSTGNDVLARHLAAEARHDVEAAAATYHDDGWYENAALGLRFEGRDLVAFQYSASWQLIPDMAARYEWELDLGDTIVQCGRITGTAGGEVLGVPARGGPLDFEFTAVISFRDGLMAGEHIWYDLERFCEQAGVDVDSVRGAAKELAASVRSSA